MKKLTILFAVVLITTSAFAQRNFDNEFYFRLGYSSPSWGQLGGDKNSWNGFDKSGFMTEIGTIYRLSSIPMPDNMVIGLDVDYLSIYWHQFSSNTYSEDIGSLRFDSKIGPSFTYSPVDKLFLDLYVKADINWLTATVFVEDDNSDDATGYAGFGAIGFSTGINLRYNIFMLGIEFNSINPKLEDPDNDGVYLGDWNGNSNKTPLPSLSFTFGMSF